MIQNTIQASNPGCFQAPVDHSGGVQDRTVSGKNWVELGNTGHFARDAYYYLSSRNYAVVPAIDDGDETLPQVRFKNQYLQEKIATINSKAFNGANSALTIIDDAETKFLFIDLDLHKQGSLPTHESCYQLGISKNLYYEAMFQASKEKPSIHLLFRLDDETLQLFREDQQRGDKFFTSDMKTIHDDRIPNNVELKLHSAFGNVRLKPGKRLYLKSRNEFPVITNFLKRIVLDIRNRNEQSVIDRKEKAKQAEIRMQNMSIEDLDEDQKARRKKGAALLNGCLEDIRNCSGGRFRMINDKVLKVGSYSADGQIDQASAYSLLLEAALSTGYSRKKVLTTVKNAWEFGLDNPLRFTLKPWRKKQ